MFLGEDILLWLMLALGAAMAVGNAAALLRPPQTRRGAEDLARAPRVRTILYAVIGAVAAIWALASLLSS